MIVAVFGDVHANLIALETFLRRVEPVAEAYVCLGDTVDYGPWNDECLERVIGLPGVSMIEGNHERLFRGAEPVEGEIELVQAFFHASRASFSRPDLIDSLPTSHTLGRYTCVHTLESRRVFADTDITPPADSIIGHSHYQYRIERGGKTIVNPGSVGQNRHRIDRVEYALYDTDRDEFTFESVPYDIDRFLQELRARDYPEACIGYYERKLADARSH